MDNSRSLVFTLINTGKRLKQNIKSQTDLGPNIPYELLAHIDTQGKTLKELSELMQCSKQEVSRQVKRAEENNWITLKPSPEDGRSKRVHFSTTGKHLVKEGFRHYSDIEKQWQKELGKEKIARLKDLLQEVNNLIDESN